MIVVGKERLEWKDLKLYHDKELMMEVVPFLVKIKDKKQTEHEFNSFKLKWPDGILSADYYNLTRAKDHAMKISSTQLELRTEDVI